MLRALAMAVCGLVVLGACVTQQTPPPVSPPESPQESQDPSGGRLGDASEAAGEEPSSAAGERAGSEGSQGQTSEAAIDSGRASTGSEAGAQALPGAPTGDSGDVWDAPVWGTPSGNAARAGEIEAQIQEVMGNVDGILGEAREDGGRDASGSVGGFPLPGGLPGGRDGSATDGGSDTGSGAAAGAGDHAAESGYPGSEASAGEPGTTVPTPDGSARDASGDSDIFRRQICEAARAESDPGLREALEAECQKYGGSSK